MEKYFSMLNIWGFSDKKLLRKSNIHNNINIIYLYMLYYMVFANLQFVNLQFVNENSFMDDKNESFVFEH